MNSDDAEDCHEVRAALADFVEDNYKKVKPSVLIGIMFEGAVSLAEHFGVSRDFLLKMAALSPLIEVIQKDER